MSINTFIEGKPIFDHSKRESKNLFSQKPNSIILQNLAILYPPECASFQPLNKNGFKNMEGKSGINYLDQINIKSHENLFKFNELKNNYINNYQKIRIPSRNDYNSQPNSLESITNNSEELGNNSKNPKSEGFLFIQKNNEKLKNEVFEKFPLISSAFKQKDYRVNNNIYQCPKKIFKIKNLSKSSKPSLLKSPKTKERRFSNKIKTQKTEINNHQIKKKKQKIFIIPNDFLIDFNIKEINIKNIEKKQPNCLTNLIDLKEARRFINNLCQTNINKTDNLNNINLVNEEYIETKNTFLLQKKRKAGSDLYEANNNVKLNSEEKERAGRGRRRRGRRKGKNKKKMTEKLKKQIRKNNRKDGNKICLYLNQIQINSFSLDIFPFYPMNFENITIEFLEGLIEEKHITINCKNELINDQRNIKYIKNKSFEIIYQHKEEETIQYILHIKDHHIFYLFFYYYHQIQENIIRLNQHFYSHRSKAELEEIKGNIENLMEKCNKLVKEILKSIE